MSSAFAPITIPETELAPFVCAPDASSRAHGLLEQQKTTWELLRNGYASLESVRTRVFDFDGFQVEVQFNPGRMTSTSAKVDPQSIRERKCFLCLENLPSTQRGLGCNGEYLLLCNPFPIFPEHFTITYARHAPQRILDAFGTLLEFARQLGDRYTVFYNGPRCGASAPDHLHFQAGTRSFLPLDLEYDGLKERAATALASGPLLRAYSFENCLRPFIALESADAMSLARAFRVLYQLLAENTPPGEEPPLNVLGFHQDSQWRILVFPRAKHRPSFYFKEGDEQLLISPAAVELGGVCITPREIDFQKVTRDHLLALYREVCIPSEQFAQVRTRLAQALA